MPDLLIRGTFPEHNFRFSACQTAELCSEGIRRHQADWLSAWLLAEALTCAALLSVTLKDEERLTLRWLYPGPVGTILADLNETGGVRGFPQRLRLLPGVTTLAEAIGGAGRISGVTSLPERVVRQGITEAVFQDVPRDLAHFLSLSFQVETALGVGLFMPGREPVELVSATGVMLQPLPGCNLLVFDRYRQQVEALDFRLWLEAEPRELEEVLAHLGVPEAPQVLHRAEPAYICNCSREKVAAVLRLIDPEELTTMRDEEGMAQVSCHFCAATYVFSRHDLDAFLREGQVGNA